MSPSQSPQLSHSRQQPPLILIAGHLCRNVSSEEVWRATGFTMFAALLTKLPHRPLLVPLPLPPGPSLDPVKAIRWHPLPDAKGRKIAWLQWKTRISAEL
jgi:hypothetical protein